MSKYLYFNPSTANVDASYVVDADHFVAGQADAGSNEVELVFHDPTTLDHTIVKVTTTTTSGDARKALDDIMSMAFSTQRFGVVIDRKENEACSEYLNKNATVTITSGSTQLGGGTFSSTVSFNSTATFKNKIISDTTSLTQATSLTTAVDSSSLDARYKITTFYDSGGQVADGASTTFKFTNSNFNDAYDDAIFIAQARGFDPTKLPVYVSDQSTTDEIDITYVNNTGSALTAAVVIDIFVVN